MADETVEKTAPASVRDEAEQWLEHFRDHANPQTAGERWEYLDQAAVLVEKLLEENRRRSVSERAARDTILELLEMLESAWDREQESDKEMAQLLDGQCERLQSRLCPVCHGVGSIPGFFLGTVKTCPTCHGRGRQ